MKNKWRLLAILIPIIIVALALILGLEFPAILELKVIDLVLRSSAPRNTSVPIAIVSVDEKSLNQIGRWPWSRDTVAQLIDMIGSGSPKVIGVDIMFPEQTPDIPDSVKENLRQSMVSYFNNTDPPIDGFLSTLERGGTSTAVSPEDARLGDTIEQAGNVVMGYYFISDERNLGGPNTKDHDSAPASAIPFGVVKGETVYVKKIEAVGILEDVAEIVHGASHQGFFNIFVDVDGTVRKIPLAFYYDGSFYPAFSLEVARSYLESQYCALSIQEYGIEGVSLGGRFIPTDDDGAIWLRYYGPPGTITNFSAADILQGQIDPQRFKDTVVLVGITAIGVGDSRVTPMSTIHPGVEIHANAVLNLLNGSMLFSPEWIKWVNVLGIILLGLCVGILLLRVGPIPGIILTSGVLITYGLLFYYLLVYMSTPITLVYQVASLGLIYVSVTTSKYFSETKRKRFIQDAFVQYLSPAVLKVILDDPGKLSLGGEKRVLTVLFSDLFGFSRVAEELSAEEIVQLLNEYFLSMEDIIFSYDGTVDKFEGDGIMAFFGAPIETRDHALNAVKAACAMQLKMNELSNDWKMKGRPTFRMRVGINTGPTIVGNMGSFRKMNYTVMGDGVNIAARLESANKIYGTRILIGEETKNAMEENPESDILFRELDLARVPGRAHPLRIFEVLCEEERPAEFTAKKLKLFSEGKELYHANDFGAARNKFWEITLMDPQDGPSKLYIQRCEELRRTPPDRGWDRVFDLTK